MPRKSGRQQRLMRATASASRLLNNVYIGAGNARRWIVLKKKLDYQSDIDFVAYLLDLAEPHSGKDKSDSKPKGQDKKDDDEDRLPSRDFEEETNDSTSSLPPEISDDGEWRPTGSLNECPLRRSPRKQTIPFKLQVRRSARNALPDSDNDVKHSKEETPHKEKKKKKEDGNDGQGVRVIETGLNEHAPTPEDAQEIPNTDTTVVHPLEAVKSSVEEEIKTTQISVVMDSEKEQQLIACEDNSQVNPVTSELDSVIELVPLEPKEGADATITATWPTKEESQKVGVVVSNALTHEEEKSSVLVLSPTVQTLESTKQGAADCSDQHSADTVRIEVGERVKLKRRKKRRSHASDEQDADSKDEESNDVGKDSKGEYSHGNKHKKRKHRHGEHSTKKKQHDIRKAPQDGIPQEVPNSAELSSEIGGQLCKKEDSDEWGPMCMDSNQAHYQPQQQQRVAIKIKLCCDCNSRHIQDACPLRSPLAVVCDAVIYKQWYDRCQTDKNGRTTVVVVNTMECKADKVLGDFVNGNFDPNTGGTDVEVVDNSQSRYTDVNRNEHSNSQSVDLEAVRENTVQNRDVVFSDVGCVTNRDRSLRANEGNTNFGEVQEEKVFPQRRSFAEASLPAGLELRVCEPEHGLSVVTRQPLRQYTQFGPLVGQPIKEMDIPDDFNMKDIWEVFTDTERQYVSTADPDRSNWLRYIRPAPTRDQRNMAPVSRSGQLFFVTMLDLGEGEELMYWADDTTTTWSKKKMEKTNCGGCNLRFAHPLYYRMHCTLFHDPNFSLTIRKYHCKVCGTAVLGKENIMKHAAEMHDGKGAYQCQYCKKFFLRLNYLEMHRTYGCAANPQRARPLCDFCGRKFCQPQKLKVHIKRMHSDMAEVLREFQCKICLKLLGSRAALQRHMKEVHHKDIVGACTCDRCGKMFQNKSNLKIHMLTHSGVKPFRCKEGSCSAAFTTKQCLQFHYKKVHSFSESNMPTIERSVAYTFDAYSGGMVNDPGRGKSPRFDKERRNSTDNNSSSLLSLDDSSSASSAKADISGTSSATDGNNGIEDKGTVDMPTPLTPPPPSVVSVESQVQLETYMPPSFTSTHTKVVVSKGSKKWMGDAISPLETQRLPPKEHISSKDVYEFEEDKVEVGDEDVSIIESNSHKVAVSVYQRPESSNASLLVEAALDAAERDIDMSGTCGVVSTSVESPTVISAAKHGSEVLYPLTTATAHHLVNGHHHALPSPIHPRTPPDGQEHMDNYTLHPTEDLVSPATTPDPSLHRQQHLSPETPPSSHLQHMDSYTLQRAEMGSPHAADMNPQNHHLHRPQVIDPYSLHHQEDLVSPADTPNPPPPRSHLVDNYALHQQEEIMSPAGTPDDHRNHVDGYGLHHQEELVSPAGTPTPRYEMHHHQVPTDNMSSDEGEGVVVAQNLSLGLKEKALQLDLAATAAAYKQYEALEVVQEFGRSSADRSGFEPLLVSSTAELQGLDMSARSSGYHHGFVSSTSQPMPRYHHTSVLYDMAAERQSVDLSMSGRSGAYSSSSPPPPYPHSDVLRVVSLDLTPGGRHSVDLSLPRSATSMSHHHSHHPHSHHHHHQLPPSTRVVSSSSPPGPRLIAPPAPPSTPNHVVPELSRSANLMSPLPSVGNQALVDPGRMISPPPPPHPGYQNYPLSPSPYHPASRTPHITSTSPSTYHHYSGYY